MPPCFQATTLPPMRHQGQGVLQQRRQLGNAPGQHQVEPFPGLRGSSQLLRPRAVSTVTSGKLQHLEQMPQKGGFLPTESDSVS